MDVALATTEGGQPSGIKLQNIAFHFHSPSSVLSIGCASDQMALRSFAVRPIRMARRRSFATGSATGDVPLA